MRERLSKRERVERTISFQPVDRVAVIDQVSWNAAVISHYAGKNITDWEYTVEDICAVIRETLDVCHTPVPPRGSKSYVDEEGFWCQDDNWTTWRRAPKDLDERGLKAIFVKRIRKARERLQNLNAKKEREAYRKRLLETQEMIGDDTVIMDVFLPVVGICECWNYGLLESFVYLYRSEPEIVSEYFCANTDYGVALIHAIADRDLCPLALIPDDLASKTGPIFSPSFLRKEFFPHLKRLVEAWHEHGVKVIAHTDGNWEMLIEDYLACDVDGFYCVEPSVGMDIVKLKNKYPGVIWAGGIDGVDLLERGTPGDVRKEVQRQVLESSALTRGGLFIGSTTEITPMVRLENFIAMVEEARSICNPDFG